MKDLLLLALGIIFALLVCMIYELKKKRTQGKRQLPQYLRQTEIKINFRQVEIETALQNWSHATMNRKAWREKHPEKPVTSREYQRLWELEIGTEIIFSIITDQMKNLSFHEWKREMMQDKFKYP